MSAPPREPLTLDGFPAWEQRQLAKHEFVNGRAYSFAGGTVAHNTIASALIVRMQPAAHPCRTYGSNMLIRMANSTRYADVVVTCDERDHHRDNLTIRHPKLVIEVLSESTANQDLGVKMREYQLIPALEEYLTIDSRGRWAQVVRRDGANWTLEAPVTGGSLQLRAVAVSINLDALYNEALIPSEADGS